MIPNQALEKAIEEGWKGVGTVPYYFKWGIANLSSEEELSWQDIALDPEFWKCLGKAMGWETLVCNKCGGKWEVTCGKCDYMGRMGVSSWLYHARCYYDLVLTDRSTDEFWKELL